MHRALKPFRYQVELADFLQNSKLKSVICRLWLGSGKTIAALLCILRLKVKKVLIVAPVRVADVGWSNEIQKWDIFNDLSFVVVKGTPAKRLKLLKEKVNIYIISTDLVPWLSTIKNLSFDMLIIDESCNFKNSNTARFKAIRRMEFEYKLLLSGTFATENMIDVWAQVYLCDKAIGTKKSFLAKYFTCIQKNISSMRYFFTYDITAVNRQRLLEDIKHLCFLAKREEYDELPEITFTDLDIYQSTEALKAYKSMKNDNIYICDKTKKEIIASSGSVKFQKLMQVCSGSCIDENQDIIHINSDKIQALKSLLEDTCEHMLIFYFYKHDRQNLLDALEDQAAIYSADSHELWNAGKLKYLLLHHSQSDGLNLQHGGSCVLWYTLPLSLRTYNQGNARVYRTGQKNACNIYNLVTQNTLEVQLLDCLKNKQLNESELMNYLLKLIEVKNEKKPYG